jgi:hypothetical protein
VRGSGCRPPATAPSRSGASMTPSLIIYNLSNHTALLQSICSGSFLSSLAHHPRRSSRSCEKQPDVRWAYV